MAISDKITRKIPSFPPATPNLTLPLNQLELLSQLLQQTAQSPNMVMTEDILTTTQLNNFPGLKFTAVISEEFNGLFWGTLVKELSDNQSQKKEQQKNHNFQSNFFAPPFSREKIEN